MKTDYDDEAGLIALRMHGRDLWRARAFPADPEAPEVYVHDGRVLYESRDALLADLAADGLSVDHDLTGAVDIDAARSVLSSNMSIDELSGVIDAWNELDDLLLLTATPLGFHGVRANLCYDKAFFGLNLPAVTPPGEHYRPAWRPRELRKIDQVLREGTARVLRTLGPSAQ